MEELLEKYRIILSNPENRYENLDKLYHELKHYVYEYFDGKSINHNFYNYIAKISKIEKSFSPSYITDTTSIFKDVSKVEKDVLYSKKHNKYPIEDYLDYIVYYSRMEIVKNNNLTESFNNIDLSNKCYKASIYVKNACHMCNLECYLIRIDPGFSRDYTLCNYSGYHYFIIVKHENKYYLVDVSYKQFFKKNYATFAIMGVPFTIPPTCGAYMMLDDFRKKVADTLNKYGWIELTDQTLKAYFDGFALSYRNALYYENRPLIYKVKYNVDDYIKFLRGEDSQLNYETKKKLGFQRVPIKNPDKSFIPKK